jgi:hypothetical protein
MGAPATLPRLELPAAVDAADLARSRSSAILRARLARRSARIREAVRRHQMFQLADAADLAGSFDSLDDTLDRAVTAWPSADARHKEVL